MTIIRKIHLCGIIMCLTFYMIFSNLNVKTLKLDPRTTVHYPQPSVESVATKCDPKVCRLPDCYCGGTDVPGGMAPENIPQLVLLTFDDAVHERYKGLYADLFEVGRKNPNGCPIQSTMYVSHNGNTDYTEIQNHYSDGHEIGSHTITHSLGGKVFSAEKWAEEVVGQREIISAYGGVKMEDVRGMRAPYLANGGNKMFKMLYDQNFKYDASLVVHENNPPSWPYTLDYKAHVSNKLPTLSYPGLWEVPLITWQHSNGKHCVMVDDCTIGLNTAQEVYKMMSDNFERHYTTNRAPFGLFTHWQWFDKKAHYKEGLIAFLDTIAAMEDVWLITTWQALQYIRDPVSLSTVKNYKPFQCNYPDRPPRCDKPNKCKILDYRVVRYLPTCQKCPEKYMWIGNYSDI